MPSPSMKRKAGSIAGGTSAFGSVDGSFCPFAKSALSTRLAEAGEMSTSFVTFSDTLNLPASQDATGMTDGSDFVDLADPISQLSTLVGQSCFFSPNSPESASPTGRS